MPDPSLPNDAFWNRLGERKKPSDDVIRKRIFFAALLMSLIVYAIPIAILAEPESKAIAAKAFGSPFGLSPRIFAFLIFTILYIPFPFVFWHAITIAMKAHDDGSGLGSVALLAYVFKVGKCHPPLRRSQFFVFGGLAYFILICGTWIVYCSILGI